MTLEIAASSPKTSPTSSPMSPGDRAGVVDHQRVGDGPAALRLDVAGEVLRLELDVAVGVRAGSSCRSWRRRGRCRAGRARRWPASRPTPMTGSAARYWLGDGGLAHRDRASAPAPGGRPGCPGFRCRWSGSRTGRRSRRTCRRGSAVRPPARPAIVRCALGQSEQAQAQIGPEVEADLEHQLGRLGVRRRLDRSRRRVSAG